MLKPSSSIIIAVSLLTFARLDAAAIPDAGSIMREQNPQRELPGNLPPREQEKPLITSEADPAVQVTVKGFRFENFQGLSTDAELQAVVAGSVGKTLNAAELKAVVGKVTAFLRSKGWVVAHAYLPSQELGSGIVTIGIVQGKSDGSIMINRNSSVRIRESRLQCIADSGVTPGEPISQDRLERAILLENDLPGVTAKAEIAPGTTPGTSAVRFNVSEGAPVTGTIWSDNQGNRYTGAWRGNGLVSINDPFHYGDQITVLYTGAAGLNQGKIGYSFPLGCNGLRGNLSWTGMNYKLQEELKSLDYKGDSSVIAGGLSYPLVKNRTTTVLLGIDYADKHLTDSQNGNGLRDKTVKVGNLSLSALHFDNWLGGGSTSAKLGLSHGDFHESNPLAIIDANLSGTQGGFTTMTAGLSRLQRVADRVTLNLSWSSQYAFDNLDSSERFFLGGPDGVRAYAVGEASGDSGHLLNADLRYQLPVPAGWGKMQIGGFYDAGHITINTNRFAGDVVSATNKNEYWLQGAGVSMNWQIAGNYVIRGSWAHTIGDNAGRSALGLNSDGKSNNSRFWLQGMIYF
ncbi:MAG: ShlB/FhaC/HecB family hemolysin secretion/activation protein [Chlorobiaceae bacterium]|nr:ShlB/FhaC/HecB family hemolysin secretion/activation protein [Chlorobiaceae bacterium]